MKTASPGNQYYTELQKKREIARYIIQPESLAASAPDYPKSDAGLLATPVTKSRNGNRCHLFSSLYWAHHSARY